MKYVHAFNFTDFKTPLGTFTILGLHGLPIWLYAHYTKVLGQSLRIHRSIQYAGIAFLSAGRAVCLTVEVRQVIYVRRALFQQSQLVMAPSQTLLLATAPELLQ